MDYNIVIYQPSITDPDQRFVLGTGGTKPLVVIGLNPSTTDDRMPDPTIKKVIGFATKYGFDSFIMLNLYAQRTPNPKKLDAILDEKLHQDNIAQIKAILEKHKPVAVLAAWGNTITLRKYLNRCLTDIHKITKKGNVDWAKIADFTKKGHPRHPSRARYSKLTGFDLDEYLTTL